MVKLPSKAFLKVLPKASEVGRYSILTPWVAMVQGRWCFCATNGRAAVMRPVPVADHATEHLPEAAKIAIPTECFKEGEPVEIVENEKAGKAGSYVVRSKSGTERRCPEVCPPDLDGLMRDRSYVSNDRMRIMVDAKVLIGVLEAMLSDITAKSSVDESYVMLSFARMKRAGDTETYIDGASPMLLERKIPFQGGIERALVMPVSGEEPAKARGASVSTSASTSASVDAEERVALAREGGANA